MQLKDEYLPARTVLWAAGVKGSDVKKSLGAPLHKSGRVRANPDLTVPGHANVFVSPAPLAAERRKEPRPTAP